MREIDLIPRDHGERRRVRRALLRTSALMAILLVASAAGRLALELSIARERPIVELRQRGDQKAVGEQSRIAELGQRKSAVEARLGRLKGLQQGASWEAVLQSVDRAFGKGIWIDQLTVISTAPSSPGLATGSATGPAATPASALKQQRVEIKGHAIDHAAVTAFTRGLREQPAVRDVRLVDTGLRRYSTTQVVDFTLAAIGVEATGRAP